MWERAHYCSFLHDTNHFAAMWQIVMWQMAHMSCDKYHVTESNDVNKNIQYSRKEKRIWCAVFDLMFISVWLKDGLFNWKLMKKSNSNRHAGKLFGNLNEMIGCARKQPFAGPACKGIAAFTWPGVSTNQELCNDDVLCSANSSHQRIYVFSFFKLFCFNCFPWNNYLIWTSNQIFSSYERQCAFYCGCSTWHWTWPIGHGPK